MNVIFIYGAEFNSQIVETLRLRSLIPGRRGDLKGGYVNAFDPTTSVYTVTRVDDNSNKWYAGAGFGYDFSSNASIGLNYDYYKATKSGLEVNPKVVSVSAEYRF